MAPCEGGLCLRLTNTMKINATYVSVWDGGIKVSSKCTYDPDTTIVDDIELSGAEGMKRFDSHHILLPDGGQLECEYNEDNDILAPNTTPLRR